VEGNFKKGSSQEMDGLLDFLFVLSLFLGIQPSKNLKKSDIKILVSEFRG